MSGRHLGQALGSDPGANTDSVLEAAASAKNRDISAAWAVAFVVCVLLALASPFL